MSLGIVITNIAEPVRQSLPASSPVSSPVSPAATTADSAVPAPGAVAAAASASAIGSRPQLASNLTVVVLQLLNEQGVVTATIPSAQQLAAYRAGTATPPS